MRKLHTSSTSLLLRLPEGSKFASELVKLLDSNSSFLKYYAAWMLDLKMKSIGIFVLNRQVIALPSSEKTGNEIERKLQPREVDLNQILESTISLNFDEKNSFLSELLRENLRNENNDATELCDSRNTQGIDTEEFFS